MTNPARPRYCLFAQAVGDRRRPGVWSFVLQSEDGAQTLSAQDYEPDARGDRLELLALVRGLEAIDQPSSVTVVTSSRALRQGLLFGLDEWRRNDWTWESFGQMVPVKNRDLWQRLDRARRVHQLEVRCLRFEIAVSADAPEPQIVLHRRASIPRPHFLHPRSTSSEPTPSATVEQPAPGRWRSIFSSLGRAWGGESSSPETTQVESQQ